MKAVFEALDEIRIEAEDGGIVITQQAIAQDPRIVWIPGRYVAEFVREITRVMEQGAE